MYYIATEHVFVCGKGAKRGSVLSHIAAHITLCVHYTTAKWHYVLKAISTLTGYCTVWDYIDWLAVCFEVFTIEWGVFSAVQIIVQWAVQFAVYKGPLHLSESAVLCAAVFSVRCAVWVCSVQQYAVWIVKCAVCSVQQFAVCGV